MRARINKRLVDGLQPKGGKKLLVYDLNLTGFGVAVYPSGRRSFFVEYGSKGARKRMTLGAYGPLTVEQARAMALDKLSSAVHGEDPLEERRAGQQAVRFGTFVDEYLEAVRKRKKQPRHDERYLEIANERWKQRPLASITPRDVQGLMLEVSGRGQTTANRWLASVRACFEEALRQGLIEHNPAMRIQKFRESPPRDRVLSDQELTRVMDAIEALTNPFVRLAFLLLIHTGARKSEVLAARWEQIDLEAGTWRIPSPKAGDPQVMPLDEHTMALLRGAERREPWVVPGRRADQHRRDLKRPWQAIREATGLMDVTIHDVRRTFGLRVSKQAGLHVASKLLRHSEIRVTERVYAPLGIDELREAMGRAQEEREGVVEREREKARRRKGRV
jgi:integrase